MSGDLTFAGISEIMKPWALASSTPAPNRLDVQTSAEGLIPAVTELTRAQWGYLSAITGRDNGPRDAAGAAASPAAAGGPAAAGSTDTTPRGTMEILYHFCRGPAIVTFRVTLPREAPSVPSLSAVVPSALMYERELAETFGIQVAGMPDKKRQFLSDDWPENLYPLRKDFAAGSVVPIMAVPSAVTI